MKISSNAVWVFDLDDTLYLERDYQLSGYQHIAQHVQNLYQKDVWPLIQDADSKGEDVLQSVCSALSLPESAKQSFIWIYRLHIPNITLSSDVEKTLRIIEDKSLALATITDGRSVSQRNKLFSLGLGKIDALISEEWDEVKPGKKRFLEIESRYPLAEQYIYVGDNIKKDFITPNQMNWLTIGLRDSGHNVHSQQVSQIEPSYLPNIWINTISELQDFLC